MLYMKTIACRSSFSLLVYAVFALSTWTMAEDLMRAVQFEEGGPEKLSVGMVPVPKLRLGQVLMKVHYTAINRADTLQRRGLYPPPKGESNILGLEAAGVISQIGPGCSGDWKVGDRVMALLPGGGKAEYTAVESEHLIPIPMSMSFKEAAAIPEVWLTAFQLLHFVGHLQPGETVLIHAGGSGVGTAAVQLVKLAGATPIVTAGSKEKIERAISLGADAGFNYKDEDFSTKVLEATNGIGVQLILDCIGGSFWEQNIKSLAIDGRWVLYGTLGGGTVNGDLFAKMMKKRISLLATTIRARSKEYKTKVIQAFTMQALPHFEERRLKPIIDTVFPLDEIAKAHTYMETNKNTGKIVLQVLNEKEEL